MPKLASLKQTYSELSKPAGVDTDEYYPTLYFDEKQMGSLEIDNPRVGSELTFIATVRVSNISESKNGSRSMCVEIIEGAMSRKVKEPDAASVIFPNG